MEAFRKLVLHLLVLEIALAIVQDVNVAIEMDAVSLAVPPRIELAIGRHDPVEIFLGALILRQIVVERLELTGRCEGAEEQGGILHPVEARLFREELRQDLGDRVAAVILLARFDADARFLLDQRRAPERGMKPVRILEIFELHVVEELLAGRNLGCGARRKYEARSRRSRGSTRCDALQKSTPCQCTQESHVVLPYVFQRPRARRSAGCCWAHQVMSA